VVDVVDQSDGPLPASAVSTRSRCAVAATSSASAASTASTDLRVRGDEQHTSELIVLGLGHQVRGEQARGSAVSSATMAISVGPARESMPQTPCAWTRALASAT
jgi:hypothetical protein